MHRGTVLGDANKRPVPKNSPVIHCQRRYYQASCAIPGLLANTFLRFDQIMIREEKKRCMKLAIGNSGTVEQYMKWGGG